MTKMESNYFQTINEELWYCDASNGSLHLYREIQQNDEIIDSGTSYNNKGEKVTRIKLIKQHELIPEIELSDIKEFTIKSDGQGVIYSGRRNNANWLVTGSFHGTNETSKLFQLQYYLNGSAVAQDSDDCILKMAYVNDNNGSKSNHFCILTKSGIFALYDINSPLYPIYDLNLSYKKTIWFPQEHGIGLFVTFEIIYHPSENMISIFLLRDDGELFLLSPLMLLNNASQLKTSSSNDNMSIQSIPLTEIRYHYIENKIELNGENLKPLFIKLDKKKKFQFDTNFTTMYCKALDDFYVVFSAKLDSQLQIHVIPKEVVNETLSFELSERNSIINKRFEPCVLNDTLDIRKGEIYAYVRFLPHKKNETKMTLISEDGILASLWFPELKYIGDDAYLLRVLKKKLTYNSYKCYKNGFDVILKNGVPCFIEKIDKSSHTVICYYENIYDNEHLNESESDDDDEIQIRDDMQMIKKEKLELEELTHMYQSNVDIMANRINKLKKILLDDAGVDYENYLQEKEILNQKINDLTNHLKNYKSSKKQTSEEEGPSQSDVKNYTTSPNETNLDFVITDKIKTQVLNDLEILGQI